MGIQLNFGLVGKIDIDFDLPCGVMESCSQLHSMP